MIRRPDAAAARRAARRPHRPAGDHGRGGADLAPPPATLAEQLCVGGLIGDTRRTWSTWQATGLVDIDVPTTASISSCRAQEYQADVDHALLYDPGMDGIDDDANDHQYRFGRIDYEGMFAAFNEHNDTFTGVPRPLALQRMTGVTL